MCCADCFNFFFLSGISLPIPEEDKSLAIPRMPRQSALLGVTEISIIFSDLF